MKQISSLFILSISFLLLIFPSSCSQEKIKNIEEYLKWINTPENGLVKEKSVNNINIKVKYLPVDYLIHQENRKGSLSHAQLDSIKAKYIKSLTFVLTIGPDTEKGANGDIMFKDVSRYTEYAQRMLTMNFDMENYVKLKAGNEEYYPVLSTMENTFGLSSDRNIIFVFAPRDNNDLELHDGKEFDFIYNGEMFDTGINHFVFKKEDMDNAPKLVAN